MMSRWPSTTNRSPANPREATSHGRRRWLSTESPNRLQRAPSRALTFAWAYQERRRGCRRGCFGRGASEELLGGACWRCLSDDPSRGVQLDGGTGPLRYASLDGFQQALAVRRPRDGRPPALASTDHCHAFVLRLRRRALRDPWDSWDRARFRRFQGRWWWRPRASSTGRVRSRCPACPRRASPGSPARSRAPEPCRPG
jgi:hypothetical protein